jgi:predicted nucleic acid-binding protein
MVVADASAVVEVLVGGMLAPRIQGRLRGDEVHAPFLLEIEALQALRRLVLSQRLSEDRAGYARDDLDAMPLALYPHRPLMERVWNLRHVLSAYDACYVALAEALSVPLVTCDSALANASGHGAEIELFTPRGS